MRRIRWLLVLAVLLFGCNGSQTPSATAPDQAGTSSSTSLPDQPSTTAPPSPSTSLGSDGQTLRVGTLAPIESLDPADALSPGDWEVLQAVGDGPLRMTPGDGELVPGIAEDLPEVSEDGLTYTLRLRDDVQFADGTPLTASGYVQSIERVMDLGGRNSDLVSLFVSDVAEGDDDTVVFQLRDPFAFFPTLLAGTAYLPVHPDSYPEDELAPMPSAPVYGVGPWYIESLSESEIVLQANPNYSGGDITPETIVIRVFEDVADMANALRGGEVDVVWRGLDSDTASSMSGTEEISVEPVAGGTMHFLVVNHAQPPTDDPLVRQAIASLIDRQAIADSTLGGAFVPTFSPYPSGYAGSSDTFLDEYGDPDVARAIELLTDAGYTETGPAEIELAYPPEQFGLQIASAMEEIELQLEATGLIDVTLTSQPWNTYVGDVVEGVYDLAFLGWLHDFPDPHNYLAPFVLDGGIGGSGRNLEHGDLIDLVQEAAREGDMERRTELYEQIQDLYADDVVTIPLWIEHPYIAYRDVVVGDQQYPNPEALNVGQSMQLDYRALQIEDD